MWVKVRLVIMGLFGLAFGLLELVALLTPAIRCEGKLEVYEGSPGAWPSSWRPSSSSPRWRPSGSGAASAGGVTPAR